ncbi:GHMP family kinase ATP-binding protein, partial [Enterococcus faecium]
LGVVSELKKNGYAILGFSASVKGNIPVGAGLSSSAAYESAIGFALNELFELKLDRLSIVKIAKAAENNFVGLQCGI